MAFERNDIVNKTRLMGELGEELMGYEHNDIVTVDVMNEAIAEGGGGGGGDFKTLSMTVIGDGGSFGINANQTDDGYTSMMTNDAGMFTYFVSVEDDAELVSTVVYMGDSAILVPSNVVKNVTGNATYDSDTGTITATGDFTVSGYIYD